MIDDKPKLAVPYFVQCECGSCKMKSVYVCTTEVIVQENDFYYKYYCLLCKVEIYLCIQVEG